MESQEKLYEKRQEASKVNFDEDGNDDDDIMVKLEWTKEEHMYATQFFGYTPKAFSDGLFNGYIDYVKEALIMTEKKMATDFSKYITPEDAERATDELLAAMMPIVTKAFDRLETYVSSHTFRIPANTVLPEDTVQLECTDTVENKTAIIDDIQRLETEVINARYINTVLRQTIRDIDSYSTATKHVLDRVTSLTDDTKRAGLMGGVSDTVEFIRSQISQAESCMDNIKKMEDDISGHNQQEKSELCIKRKSSKETNEHGKKLRKGSN